MIVLKYWNPLYNIALFDWQTVYQLPQEEVMLKEVYRGALYYRLRGASTRISYLQLKRGLVRKLVLIKEKPLPF